MRLCIEKFYEIGDSPVNKTSLKRERRDTPQSQTTQSLTFRARTWTRLAGYLRMLLFSRTHPKTNTKISRMPYFVGVICRHCHCSSVQ